MRFAITALLGAATASEIMHSFSGPKLCMEFKWDSDKAVVMTKDRVLNSALDSQFHEGSCCSSDFCQEDALQFYS